MRANRKYFSEKPSEKNKSNINNNIKAVSVRLIDENGENIGIVNTKDAIQKAHNIDLDLVQVSDSNPPVCKIMDYGKYVYEQSKKNKNITKSSKHEDKEIRLRPSTCQHDLEIKANKAKQFLAEGRKVNINFKLIGREKRNIDIVHMVLQNFYSLLKDVSRLEIKGGNYVLIPV